MKPLHILMFLVALLVSPLLALLAWTFNPLAPAVAWMLSGWQDELLGRFAFMAVVNTLSTTLTNLDAAQVTHAASYIDGSKIREKIETLETANGDSVGSTYRFFRVPSWARVTDLILDSDDIGTTTAADFGLYRTAADGGAVVDADFFASAVVLNGGALANQNITHESAVVDAADYGKRIWEQLGLSADPQVEYDVAATLTGAADAAATMTLRIRYSDGN